MSQHTVQPSNGSVLQSAVVAGTADLAASAWAVPANPNRRVVEFYNNASVTVYVSTSNVYATAVATGRPLAAGGAWSDSASGVAWYVFAASGTAEVRVTQVQAP